MQAGVKNACEKAHYVNMEELVPFPRKSTIREAAAARSWHSTASTGWIWSLIPTACRPITCISEAETMLARIAHSLSKRDLAQPMSP
jgi:hypothetical protein